MPNLLAMSFEGELAPSFDLRCLQPHRQLPDGGVRFESAPHLIRQTGRLIANFRDPDGWRMQLVDSNRVEPKE